MESENGKIDRRTFLKTTGMGGAALAMSSGLAGRIMAAEATGDTPSKPIPTRILGKTGISVPILAMGGENDWTANLALLRIAFNMGVTYWDTSDGYRNGKSEAGIGQYFEKYPEDRKKIFLVTKTDADKPEGLTEGLRVSLERMKTDYVDLYFIHALRGAESLSREVKAWVEQKKKEGKIRSFGFSTHMNVAPFLTHAATLGWIDAIMPTYNYRTMINDDIKRSVDACAKARIGLVAMKVMAMRSFGTDSSEELALIKSFTDSGYTMEQAKLKAVWKDERIASCCVSMYSLNLLKDNVAAAVDSRQLSGREIEMMRRLAENTCDRYCMGCMKCASVMGSESRIPDVMRYMMYYNSYGERDEARRQFRALPETVRNSLELRDYSSVELACPHKIEIGRAMKEAARILG